MEFVVHVLQRFFGIGHTQAVEIMMTVHRKGLAVVGVFSFEIAETKVTQVMDYARRNQHPCSARWNGNRAPALPHVPHRPLAQAFDAGLIAPPPAGEILVIRAASPGRWRRRSTRAASSSSKASAPPTTPSRARACA
jgi:hypothetical protein